MYHVICTPHHGRWSWVSSEHETLATAVDEAADCARFNRYICHYRVSPVDCPPVSTHSDELPQPLYELCFLVDGKYVRSAVMDMLTDSPAGVTWAEGRELFDRTVRLHPGTDPSPYGLRPVRA